MGIGGEYAAINSAIDEMIPAKYRGRVDLAVNGTYWAGAILGTIVTLWLLNHVVAGVGLADRLPGRPGPRAGDHLRPAAPAGDPRAGRSCTAGRKRPRRRSAEIEHDVRRPRASCRRWTRARNWRSGRSSGSATWRLLRGAVPALPQARSVLVSALMITQSFLYNAIFFTYGLVLEFYFHVNPATDTAYYFFAFAAGNLLGPLTPRAAVRHGRPAEDDLGHVHPRRRTADHQRRTVRDGALNADDPDDLLGGRVLLRLGGRQRRLPDRERGLPARGPGAGHRRVLRDRAALRRVRLALVRPPDRRRHRTATRCSSATWSARAR